MVLGQPVAVAVDEAALALDTEQAHFLIAIEASFSIFLRGLLNDFLHCVGGVFAAGVERRLFGLNMLSYDFFLFLICIFPESGHQYLWQEEQKP